MLGPPLVMSGPHDILCVGGDNYVWAPIYDVGAPTYHVGAPDIM